MKYRRAIILVAAGTCISGCFGAHVAEPEDHYLPTQAAEYYLLSLSSPPKESTMYRCLTNRTRESVPFTRFSSSLSALRGTGHEGEASGRVTIADRIDISDLRSVVYAILQRPAPRDDFMLVRVDCRLEEGEWRIELPSSGGSFPPADVLLSGKKLDERSLTRVEDIIGADRVAIEADLQRRKRGEEMRAAFRARDENLADLIILGKGCYNSGHYRKAMMAFSKALRMDPENALAREYAEKCRTALRKE